MYRFILSYYCQYCLFVALVVGCSGCIKQSGCTDTTAINYDPYAVRDDGSCIYVPNSPPIHYVFLRQFQSSVNYKEQTIHQLLLQNISHYLTLLGTSEGIDIDPDTLRYFFTVASKDVYISSPTTIPAPLTQQTGEIQDTYTALSVLVGNTLKATINSYIDGLVANCQTPAKGTPAVYTTAEYVDLKLLIENTLLGAVLFAQGTNLLNVLPDKDNATLVSNQYYTSRENYLDRAFGYLGASIAYSDFSTADLLSANACYDDLNADNAINLNTEYNYSFARLAAARQYAYNGNDLQYYFKDTIWTFFMNTRMGITAKENDTIVRSRRIKIIAVWEEIAAATAVHHLNALQRHIDLLNTPAADPVALGKEWTATVTWLANLGFNPKNRLTNLQDLLLLLDSWPPVALLPNTSQYIAYRNGLNIIRDYLKNTYGFSPTAMEQW